MIMVPVDRVTERDVSFLDSALLAPPPPTASAVVTPLHDARDQFEKEYILRTLAAQQGNMSRTAEVLGIERSNLYRKMRRFGIAPSRRADEDPEPS